MILLDLQALLRHCGISGTYITPTGGNPQDWRVVGLPLSIKHQDAHSEATKQLAEIR